MSSLIDFKIEGGKELAAALKRLPIQLEKTAVREALGDAAKIVSKDAKRRAPTKSGTLKRSIQIVRRRQPNLITIATRSGRKWQPKRANAWYAHFVEFGSSNEPARPFLRPALDSNKIAIIRTMSSALQKAIRRFAAGYRTRAQAKRGGFTG